MCDFSELHQKEETRGFRIKPFSWKEEENSFENHERLLPGNDDDDDDADADDDDDDDDDADADDDDDAVNRNNNEMVYWRS